MRHRAWTIPVGLLGGILLLAGFAACILFIVETSFKHSDAYQEALATARNDPRVVEQLGEPLHEGWFASGQIKVSSSSGYAELSIPLSGTKGAGTLYVVARKSAGRWSFDTLRLQVAGHEEAIDLLETQPAVK